MLVDTSSTDGVRGRDVVVIVSRPVNMLKNEIPKATWMFYPVSKNGKVVGTVSKWYDAEGHLVKEAKTDEEMWETAYKLGLEQKLMAMYRIPPMEWRVV